jgi:hypothetical protein
MDNPDTPKTTEPDSVPKRRFVWLRRLLFTVAVLITLFVLFHAEENWRGARAWKHYRTTVEAQGAVLDFEAFAPPPVPDAENFAMTPLLRPLLDLYTVEEMKAKGLTSRWKDTNGYNRAMELWVYRPYAHPTNQNFSLPQHSNWRMGERLDLTEWAELYRRLAEVASQPEASSAAAEVLRALRAFDDELAELHEASQRPHARFNIEYDKEEPFSILLPHLGVLKTIAEIARLRAVAALAAGNADQAFDDVNLILYFIDAIKNEPFLITHLVRIAMHEVAMQTIWEGLVDHRWRPEHLTHWQARLDRQDFIADLKRAMKTERAGCNRGIEWIQRNPEVLPQITDGGPAHTPDLWPKIAWRLVPRGWFDFERVNYNRVFDDFILAALPDDASGLDVAKIRLRAAEFEALMKHMHNPARAVFRHQVLSSLLLPAVNKAVERSAAAHVTAQMAIMAMALERHRLAHGGYPESLDALAPDFVREIPHDPLSGKPLRYERTGDGTFRLWSVGWNGTDEGGRAVKQPAGRTVNWTEGDWVWPQPVTAKASGAARTDL